MTVRSTLFDERGAEPAGELALCPRVPARIPTSHGDERSSATARAPRRPRLSAMDVFGLFMVVSAPIVLLHFAGWPTSGQLVSAARAVVALRHGRLEVAGLRDGFTATEWATWAALVATAQRRLRAIAGRRADPPAALRRDRPRLRAHRSARRNGVAPVAGRSDDTLVAGAAGTGTTEAAPGDLVVGSRGGQPVRIALCDLAGVCIEGPGAEDVARTVVVRALGAGTGTEVATTEEVARRLWGDFARPTVVKLVGSLDALARVVEAERIARCRQLDDPLGARPSDPERGGPSLLVLAGSIPSHATGRWATLVATPGTVVVFLEPTPLATGTLRVDARRAVTAATPAPLAARLSGAVLDAPSAEQARTQLQARPGAICEPDALAEPSPSSGDPRVPLAEAPSGRSPKVPGALSQETPPLVVRVLGPYTLRAFGVELSSGMRSRAKALIAYYVLHPEGARVEQAVDDLWPEIGPDQVLKQFWRALGDLRSHLERTGHTHMEVLVKTGNHYRCNEEEVACDLWDFERALDAAAQRDDEPARGALRRAVDAYRGDLMSGLDFPWAEPLRVRLRIRALDACLRLAALEESEGRLDAAVAVLERALDVDPYAEGPFCRLMTLHAERGHLDAVSATWQLLTRRLSELGVVPSAATTSLHERLVRPG